MNSLSDEQREKITHFTNNFDKMKQRIIIVDKTNINAVETLSSITEENDPSVIIMQCEDDPANPSSPLNALIKQLKRSKHSLIVFAEPLYGLQSYKLKKALNIKVRNVVLPRLVRPLK